MSSSKKKKKSKVMLKSSLYRPTREEKKEKVILDIDPEELAKRVVRTVDVIREDKKKYEE